MKTIINGKVYDTETAKFIGRRTSGVCKKDLEWYEETLYQNGDGEFFLYGQGNYRSKYAKEYGISCGWKIMPLTYESAIEWAKKHLPALFWRMV